LEPHRGSEIVHEEVGDALRRAHEAVPELKASEVAINELDHILALRKKR